ncbi:MAG TPA: altronate dehydratase family protein [Desulfomonilaceae bacterium]|nr:altronate dehydratase family protein [Desulfomonilaceae bacterium]
MTNAGRSCIRLHPDDSVVVALNALSRGERLPHENVVLLDDIPAGHKAAVHPIAAGAAVIKYGQIIGFASADIEPGRHVHTHNVTLHDFSRDYAYCQGVRPTQYVANSARRTFEGFLRPDDSVGIRNYVGIISTVTCSLSTAHLIARRFGPDVMARYPNADGVVALGANSGCCMTPGGDAITYLQRSLAAYARHPNFAGVLILGLGCEQNLVQCLLSATGFPPDEQVLSMVIQDEGGTNAAVEKGFAAVSMLLERTDKVRRRTFPASRLKLGLECGGSDGYSGITANPALGAAADLLVCNGGTAVLSETPEIYGAEHLLTRRAVHREVGEKLVGRIRWWEEYMARNGGQLNNNPTPGNKAGGITTILEKSLGATTKGGNTNLVDVVGFAEPVNGPGLVFMDTPGFDPVSVTGLIAGGVHLIAFTTGRGTVMGSVPAPTLKLASNSALYRRMQTDMDMDCGKILDGGLSIEEMGAQIFDRILEIASGRKTKSERAGQGQWEFHPWYIGAVV